MNSGIRRACVAVLLALASKVSAQTGVSGQPGIPTTGLMTPLPDASSSPTLVSPPPTPPPPPTVESPPAPRPAEPPPPVPAASPVPAPAPAPAAPSEQPESASRKKHGASFYMPYLTAEAPLDRAISDLTAQVAAKPEDPGLRNDLGNLLARRGFAKEAREQYEKAEKLDREFFLADYNEGLLWEKEGKPSAAIAAYRRSIRRKPGFPLSRFHLGFLYEKEGRNEAAVREYAKALRIDPSLRSPRRNPLVVQTRLLYRASLQNYDRDLAAAALTSDGEFADRAVWERLQPQRPVDTSELDTDSDETTPQVVGARPGKPTSAPIIGGKPAATAPVDPRRQQLIDQFRRSRRPTRANPSRTVIPPPAGQAPVAPAPAAIEPPPTEDENTPVQEEPPPAVRVLR